MLRTIMRTVLVIAALLFVGFVLYRCVSGSVFPGQSQLPLGLEEIIPTSWKPIADKAVTCSFDADAEPEWLVVYSYDSSSFGPEDSLSHSQIGAVVYDSQVNRVPQSPGSQAPVRPAMLVPYPLLPDIYASKGQGYLGESDVQVQLYQPARTEACASPEITIYGAATGALPEALPTYLSIFRWGGEAEGYQGAHYVGNARVAVEGDSTKPIARFATYNRLNDRSMLCAVQHYARPVDGEGQPSSLDFTEEAAAYTIDFCFRAPGDPYHPEGVVVALLRGYNPANADGTTPTGDSFFTPNALASLPAGLESLATPSRSPYSILSLTNQGALAPIQSEGWPCVNAAGVTTGDVQWWCGQNQATVLTEILVDETPRNTLWTLVSMANESATSDVYWRVDRVELQ